MNEATSPSTYAPSPLPTIQPRLNPDDSNRRRPPPSQLSSLGSPSIGEPPVPTKSPDNNNQDYNNKNDNNGMRDRSYEGGERGQGGRASESSSVGTRFIGNYAGSESGGQYEYDDKVKADYEYSITLLQKKVAELGRENEELLEDNGRIREMESQIRSHIDVSFFLFSLTSSPFHLLVLTCSSLFF